VLQVAEHSTSIIVLDQIESMVKRKYFGLPLMGDNGSVTEGQSSGIIELLTEWYTYY
jgi:hypothetical protein